MSKTYWVDRIDEQNRRLLDKTEAQIMRQLIKLYEHSLLVLKKDIKQLYADIITNQVNDTIGISDFYQYDRYYKMANDLNTNLASLNKSSIELLEDKFEKMYVDSQLVLNKLNKNWSNDYIKDPRPVINEI